MIKKFTLIELLVVIAIIGILTSILLPALAGARSSAMMKVCMSNQRQINIAAQTYATDNNELVIGDYNSAPSTMFFATMYLGYMGGPSWSGALDVPKMDEEFAKIGAYQCPASIHETVPLDFLVNSLDMPNYEEKGNYQGIHAHNLNSMPKSLNEIIYVLEANTKRGLTDANRYNLWDIFKPGAFTFNLGGGPNNENNSRSMYYGDQRHMGKMNVSLMVTLKSKFLKDPAYRIAYSIHIFNIFSKIVVTITS